jgi:hypothetical protein
MMSLETISKPVSTTLPATSPPSKVVIIPQQRYDQNEKIPEKRYTGEYHYTLNSRQIGFIYNNAMRYPLFEQRLGRNFYYHTVDGGRNGIRVVLNTPKNEMLYDGDKIPVQELGGEYTVKMYDYSGNLYNPFEIT